MPSAKLNSKEQWAHWALHDLFPSACGVACKPVRLISPSSFEDEKYAPKNVVLSRKLEFLAGRAAAREALGLLGLHMAVIPIHENRSPIWPSGFIGSIAHSEQIAVAAVAKNRDLVAIGLDIEGTSAVTKSLWSDIFLGAEIEFLQRLPENERNCYATVIFSAKEAFYKFQFPHTQTWLGFHDVQVTLDPENRSCDIMTANPISIGHHRSIRYAADFRISEWLVMTAVVR